MYLFNGSCFKLHTTEEEVRHLHYTPEVVRLTHNITVTRVYFSFVVYCLMWSCVSNSVNKIYYQNVNFAFFLNEPLILPTPCDTSGAWTKINNVDCTSNSFTKKWRSRVQEQTEIVFNICALSSSDWQLPCVICLFMLRSCKEEPKHELAKMRRGDEENRGVRGGWEDESRKLNDQLTGFVETKLAGGIKGEGGWAGWGGVVGQWGRGATNRQ